MIRRRAITADEVDVHSRWRRYHTCYQRAGKAAKVKRATNRRERREGKTETERNYREEADRG